MASGGPGPAWGVPPPASAGPRAGTALVVEPAGVSAGAQTQPPPSRLAGADAPLLGGWCPAAFQASVRPRLLKPLLCYLNPSLLATVSSVGGSQ